MLSFRKEFLSSRFLSKSMKITIPITIIMPFVLYGCATWPLSLREERWPGVSQNRVLKRIFGPKRDVVTGEGRKPNND